MAYSKPAVHSAKERSANAVPAQRRLMSMPWGRLIAEGSNTLPSATHFLWRTSKGRAGKGVGN